MKKRTGLLLVCALLAALLLSGCSGQKQVEYRADLTEPVTIPAGGRALIPTGLRVAVLSA